MQEKRGKGPEVHIVLPRGEQNRLRRGTAFLCKIGFKNDLPEVGLPCAFARVHLGARLMWWRCHPGAGANDTAAPAGVCGWALAGTVGLQGCPALHSRQGTAAAATVDASSARCDCSAWVQIPCDPKLILPPFNPQQLAAFKLTELEKASDAWWRGGGARVHAVMECGCRLWWGVDAGRDGMRVPAPRHGLWGGVPAVKAVECCCEGTDTNNMAQLCFSRSHGCVFPGRTAVFPRPHGCMPPTRPPTPAHLPTHPALAAWCQDVKRDMLFEEDLGIPITTWNIGRWAEWGGP